LSNTASVTASLVDVLGYAYTPTTVNDFVVKSYGYPSFTGYSPSPFSSTGAPATSYSGAIASASSSGATVTITAHNLGQCIVEVQYPTFNFEASALDAEPSQASGNPVMIIFAQVIVSVVA